MLKDKIHDKLNGDYVSFYGQYLELKRSGKNYMTCCPFHDDRNPSFHIKAETGRFMCFACQEKGDAIDFICKLKGLSFKDALKHLGVTHRKATPKKNKAITKLKKQKDLVDRFKHWENMALEEYRTLIRVSHKLLAQIKTEADLDRYGDLFHSLEYWKYCRNTLCMGDEETRFEFFKGLHNA